jgi:hypothetical protein
LWIGIRGQLNATSQNVSVPTGIAFIDEAISIDLRLCSGKRRKEEKKRPQRLRVSLSFGQGLLLYLGKDW